jgi:hypothetical protein
MPPYLPPELIENTIERIEHQKTLAACSLVCRMWAPIAQSKYFRYLHFGPSPDEAIRFLQMIRESPHIALLPRSIRSSQWEGEYIEDDRITLSQVAALLINVSTLYLANVYLPARSRSSQNTRRLVEAFPRLRELGFHSCTVELHSFSLFFQSHPALHALSFHLGVIWVGQPRDLPPFKGLRRLRISHITNISPVIPFLVDREAPLAPIDRLELVSLSRSESATVYKLLFGLRHILHILEIGSPHPDEIDDRTLDGRSISIVSSTN